MKRYKHIFFDLDRTLWDFDKNSALTLHEIIRDFQLNIQIPNPETFIALYQKHNDDVWELYRKKEIRKDDLRIERFTRLFKDFNIENHELVKRVAQFYIENSPRKSLLIDNAYHVLTYLKSGYSLYVISNGFYDVQKLKLESSGIPDFFKRVFTSEQIGDSKPSKRFFEYAIKTSNAKKTESLVIGDDYANDILGAKGFGLDQVWLNPNGITPRYTPTYMIKNLIELKDIL